MNLTKSKYSSIARSNNTAIYQRYLNDIFKYNPITREEEIELFERYKNGDERALTKIINHNVKFVISVAKMYQSVIESSNLTLEDLIADGNIGLIKAAKRFDNTRNIKFISYAVWWIKSSIITCIQNNIRTIRTSASQQNLSSKLNKIEAELEQRLCRDISSDELLKIAKEKKIITKKHDIGIIYDIKRSSRFNISLSKPIESDGTLTLTDVIEDKNIDNVLITMGNKDLEKFIKKILDKIPEKIRGFIIMHYGLNGEKPITVVDIAKIHGMCDATINWQMKRYCRKIMYWYRKEYIALVAA